MYAMTYEQTSKAGMSDSMYLKILGLKTSQEVLSLTNIIKEIPSSVRWVCSIFMR